MYQVQTLGSSSRLDALHLASYRHRPLPPRLAAAPPAVTATTMSTAPMTVPHAQPIEQVPATDFYTHGLGQSWPLYDLKDRAQTLETRAKLEVDGVYNWHYLYIKRKIKELAWDRQWQMRLYHMFKWMPFVSYPMAPERWGDGYAGDFDAENVRPCYRILWGTSEQNAKRVTANLLAFLEDQALPPRISYNMLTEADTPTRVAHALTVIFEGPTANNVLTPATFWAEQLKPGQNTYMHEAILHVWPEKLTCAWVQNHVHMAGLGAAAVKNVHEAMICTAKQSDADKIAATLQWVFWLHHEPAKEKTIQYLTEKQCADVSAWMICAMDDLQLVAALLKEVLVGQSSQSLDSAVPRGTSAKARLQAVCTFGADTQECYDFYNEIVCNVYKVASNKPPSKSMFKHNFKTWREYLEAGIDVDNRTHVPDLPYPWDDVQEFVLQLMTIYSRASNDANFKEAVTAGVQHLTARQRTGFVQLTVCDMPAIVLHQQLPCTGVGAGYRHILRNGVPTGPLNPENDPDRDCVLMAMNNAVGRNIWPADKANITHGPMDRKQLDRLLYKHHKNRIHIRPHKVNARFNVLAFDKGMHIVFARCTTKKDTEARHAMLYDANRKLLNLGQINADNQQCTVVRVQDIDMGVGSQNNLETFLKAISDIKHLRVFQAAAVLINAKCIDDYLDADTAMEYNPELPSAAYTPSEEKQTQQDRRVKRRRK